MAPADVARIDAGLKPPPEKEPLCYPQEAATRLTPALQRIQALRGRRLFALAAETINDEACTEVYARRGAIPTDFDLLIHSPGGALGACYQVARILSRKADAWEALVPGLASSGATLICLGSSRIVMSGIAQLGPIDPQVFSKRHEKFFMTERQSPLEAFQAVKYLTQFSVTCLDAAMGFLLHRRVAPKPALETAGTLAFHLAEPILSKIDPYDLGAFALDSTLSLNYCERVGNPADLSKTTQRGVPYKDLVEKYPAHEFIIDIEEARQLGFNVCEPEGELADAFDAARPALDSVTTYIGLVPVSQSEGAA